MSSLNPIMPPTLATLAPELQLHIAEYLPIPDLQAFLRSNRRLYHLLLGSLYQRAVASGSCGHCHSLQAPPRWRNLPWLGNARQLTLSLAAGFDVNAIVDCQEGRTRLHLAVQSWCGTQYPTWKAKEEEKVIQLLLMRGADVNARDGRGLTPFHLLAWGPVPKEVTDGRIPNPVLNMLLRHGANINAVSNDGETPLHLAVGPSTNYGMLTVLLGLRGMDPNMLDNESQSPLHYALTRSGHVGVYRVVELLLHRGADPNLFDARGRRPLHYAMRYIEDPGVVELLLAYGADPEVADTSGPSALDYALTYDLSYDVVTVLLRFGAEPYHTSGYGW